MKPYLIFVTFVLMSFSCIGYAQTGTIKGQVSDGATNENLPGVRIMIKHHKRGDYSDLDGKFRIQATKGAYDLQLTYFGFDTLTILSVKIEPGEINDLGLIQLHSEASSFDEVIVSAQRKTDTENAILSLKQKSSKLIDGMSSAKFKKTGDSDAGAAMKRIPGVSLNEGKYVFVRGIGDRYSKTLLNGLEVPGLDPDRNSVQMDLFPTKVIDNIVVYKSASADLPADFTGGLIDISLKSAASEKLRSFSLGTAYNPNYHFNPNYLTYETKAADILGFGKNDREIPADTDIPFFAEAISNSEKGKRYQDILKSFDPNLAAFKSKSLMDIAINANLGNSFKKEKYKLGYILNVSYKNQTKFYENALFSRYGLSTNRSVNALELREKQNGSYGENNVLLSGMLGISLNTQKSVYNFNLLHLQNGNSVAGIFDYSKTDQGAVFSGFQHNLEYTQRSLSNLLISGSHKLTNKEWKIDWSSSVSLSSIDNPDIRFTRYEIRNDGSYNIGTESGFPERIWRELNEVNSAAKIDFKKTSKMFGNAASFKFGAMQAYKKREFEIRSFSINVRNVDLTGNPDELFAQENLWPYNNDVSKGTTFETPFIPVNPNEFSSSLLSTGVYAQTEVSPIEQLKIVLGLRTEYFTQRYTGRDQMGTHILNNDKVLDELDLFPSLNLVYAVAKNQNIRISYGKTTARPSFKELSYSEILDPITGRTFIGGLFRDANDVLGVEYWDGNLKSSIIHNLDLRWEIFHKRGQTFSFGGFYKSFKNPIEIVQFASQAGAFQPRNVGDGRVLGLEFEGRQSLDCVSPLLENFKAIFNVTLVQSQIKLSKTEYESKVINARVGQEIERFRDMAGQAPWIINGGLEYSGIKNFGENLIVGVYYNVQGKTLMYSGIADRPAVYSVPFHSLNMNFSKRFGKEDQYDIGIRISNILNAKEEAVFSSFETINENFYTLKKGITVGLKLAWSL